MSILYQNNFDALTAGTQPAGWTDIAGTSRVVATNPVSGANAFGETSPTNGDLALYTAMTAQADACVQFAQRANISGSTQAAVGPLLRASSDGQNWYLASYDPAANWLYWAKVVGGTLSIINVGGSNHAEPGNAALGGTNLSDGDYYIQKLEVEGSTLRWKIWRQGTAEPNTWASTITDTSISAAGVAGIRYGLNLSGVAVTVDDLYIGDAGETFTPPAAATAVTLSGPSGGPSGAASGNFTVALSPGGGTVASTVTVTPSDSAGGGTFTPSTIGLTTGSPSATFTYTPASLGAKTISVTNDGGLTNPSNLTYTAASYTRVDAASAVAGQNITLLIPSNYSATTGAPLVIKGHGAGETDDTTIITGSIFVDLDETLCAGGYILAASNQHGDNWGNQAGIDDLADLYSYVIARYKVTKIVLLGQSMGALSTLLLLSAARLPLLVGWAGIGPVCSLANLYSIGTFTGGINTAYGIDGSHLYAAQTAGHDPALLAGTVFGGSSVGMRFYASVDDTVVPKAQNTDVLAALVAPYAAEVVVVSGTGPHGDPTTIQPSDLLTFFNRCLARSVGGAVTGMTGLASGGSL